MTLKERTNVRCKYEHRDQDSPHGRFGGGWQWKVGVQSTYLRPRHGTIILNLLVSTLRISWGRPA